MTAVMTMVAVGVLQLSHDLFKHQSRNNNIMSLMTLKTSIESLLADPAIWQASINHNLNNMPSMNCLRQGTDCTAQAAPSVNPIYGIAATNGSVLFNFTPPGKGFDTRGKPCTTFSETGNDACPFTYNLRWEPRCIGGVGGCRNPTVRIIGTLKYRPKTQTLGPLNPKNYNVDFFRYSNEGSISGTCASINGAFDPTTHNCTLPASISQVCSALGGTYNATTGKCTTSSTKTCATGKVVSSIQGDGGVSCTTLISAGSCSGGKVAIGFDSNGKVLCQDVGPIVGNCASGEVMVGLNPDGSARCVSTAVLMASMPAPTPVPVSTPSPPCTNAVGSFSPGYACAKLTKCASFMDFMAPTGVYTNYTCTDKGWNITYTSGGCGGSTCPSGF